MFIWTAVSFGLLVLLLYKVALPPLLAFLAQREQQIADQLAAAAADQQRSAELLAQHKKELAEVHRKAEELLAQARDEGRKTRDEIIAKAGGEAGLILEKAKQDLAREKSAVLSEARKEIVDLVTAAAGKILRQKLTAEQDRALIERSLQESRG